MFKEAKTKKKNLILNQTKNQFARFYFDKSRQTFTNIKKFVTASIRAVIT